MAPTISQDIIEFYIVSKIEQGRKWRGAGVAIAPPPLLGRIEGALGGTALLPSLLLASPPHTFRKPLTPLLRQVKSKVVHIKKCYAKKSHFSSARKKMIRIWMSTNKKAVFWHLD